MVKADAAYDSAIIDPYGHIIKWVAQPEATQAIAVADVSSGTGNTPYSTLGDWLGWLNLIGMAFFIMLDLLATLGEKIRQNRRSREHILENDSYPGLSQTAAQQALAPDAASQRLKRDSLGGLP